MRKRVTAVEDVLYDLIHLIVGERKNIHESKVSKTLKYHYVEVLTCEILDLRGHKYELSTGFGAKWIPVSPKLVYTHTYYRNLLSAPLRSNGADYVLLLFI